MILNERDKRILGQMNGFGAMTVEQVSESMNVKFTVAARRVRQYVESGLVRRFDIPLMSVKPLSLTSRGCRATEDTLAPLEGMRSAEVRHDLMLVDVARLVVARHGGQFIPVRRLRNSEYAAGQHLPDALLVRPNRPDVAIELELSAKSTQRLSAILAEYSANLRVAEVWYLTDNESVARLVRKLAKDQEHIRVGIIGTSGKSSSVTNDARPQEAHRG